MRPIEGRVVLVGDDIDTDRIIAARYCDTVDPAELAARLFEDLDPSLRPRLAGAILVAGRNFGCGSSRETAPLALAGAGVRAVVAVSLARIFYRNAVNVGLPVVRSGTARETLADGQAVRLELEAGILAASSGGRPLAALEPLPMVVARILAAGGLVALVRDAGRR